MAAIARDQTSGARGMPIEEYQIAWCGPRKHQLASRDHPAKESVKDGEGNRREEHGTNTHGSWEMGPEPSGRGREHRERREREKGKGKRATRHQLAQIDHR